MSAHTMAPIAAGLLPFVRRVVMLTLITILGLCAYGLSLKGCEPDSALASSLDCEGIKDPDRRHFCRASTSGSSTECALIRNGDLRRLCRATLGK
jgi:hypothetical protein